MLSHRTLSESKSSQFSRTLLSILADLNYSKVWMATTCPLISKSSFPLTNPLRIVPSSPIATDIPVTFMFHSSLSSLARSLYLSLISLFKFSLCGVLEVQSSLVCRFSLLLLTIIRSGRLAEIRWFVSLGRIMACEYIICSYGQV